MKVPSDRCGPQKIQNSSQNNSLTIQEAHKKFFSLGIPATGRLRLDSTLAPVSFLMCEMGEMILFSCDSGSDGSHLFL
jgi:hypothetical protein